jgi:hypothetical protein
MELVSGDRPEPGHAMSAPPDTRAALAALCRLVVAAVPAAGYAEVTVDGEVVASAGDQAGPGADLLLPTTNGTKAILTVHGDVDLTALDQHVVVAGALVAAAESIDQLDRALANRAVIEQAKGILMATHRTTDTEAFRMLVERSQAMNRKLHVVAEEFVADVSAD